MDYGGKKNKENMYSEARKKAALCNAKLKTRESAAEVLGIAPDTLGKYERGETKCIPPDRIADLAREYNMPELATDYCMNVCPIHSFLPVATKETGIQGIVLRMIRQLNEGDLKWIKEKMIGIAEDGVVTESEIPEMTKILSSLENIAETISEMKIVTMKSIGQVRK